MRIDEDEFLDELLPTLRHGADLLVPPGDDCAGIVSDSEHVLLMAVDQVVGGVHYFGTESDDPTPIGLAGRKLMARNLSDVAAMGGVPSHALTAISWPKSADRRRLDEFMAGVRECAEEYDVDLIGGDLCSSPTESASLTIVGRVEVRNLCLRRNARPGDRIFVTGRFGGSLASGRHLTFSPRLREGRWLATQRLTSCMIDVSDGLLKDLERICAASAVAADMVAEAIPRHDGCSLQSALYDGEDYELIVIVPQSCVNQLRSTWPFEVGLAEIGQICEMRAERVRVDGMTVSGDAGFDHFNPGGTAG